MLNQFERITATQVNQPLTSLGMDARLLAVQLQQTTANLNALVDRQRECVFQNLDLFLSGVNTVSEDLKRGIPFVDPGAPRLSKFQFEGLRTPNVVPKEGGRLTLTGFRLWEQGGAAPEVAILNPARTSVVASVTAQPANSTDALSFVLESRLVNEHLGECLQVRVRPFEHRRVVGLSLWNRQTSELYMPLCIPKTYGLQVGMEATVDYTVGTPDKRPLSSKRFAFVNGDISNSINVSETKSWQNEIPDGWNIVEVVTNVVRKTGDSNIGIAFKDTAVTAAGSLSDAEDLRLGLFDFQRVKLNDTVWVADVTPIIAGTNHNPKHASQVVARRDFMTPATRLCAEFEVQGMPDPLSTFSLRIDQFSRTNTKLPPLYQSTNISTNANSYAEDVQSGGYTVSIRFNPRPVQGKMQLCTTVASTGSCGF